MLQNPFILFQRYSLEVNNYDEAPTDFHDEFMWG